MCENLSRRCQAEIVIYHCMDIVYTYLVDEEYRTVCVNVSGRLCITKEVLPKFSRIFGDGYDNLWINIMFMYMEIL